MLPFAPRLHPSLLAALTRLDSPDLPIAETNRRLGEVAELIGVPRPSYEQTRFYVHQQRQRPFEPSVGDVLLALLSPAPKLALDRLFWEANRDRWEGGK